MPIQIVPFTSEYEPAVRSFNSRLNAGGVDSQIDDDANSPKLLKKNGAPLFQERFLAVDEAAEVHGAYLLKHQQCMVRGDQRDVSCYQFPISEGVVNSKYNFVGLQILQHAIRQQPLLFSLGMGGRGYPMPKLLKAARWELAEVPFLFHVVHPFAFFRQTAALRRSRLRAAVADSLAFTGVASIGMRLLNLVRTRRRPVKDVTCQIVDTFDKWADDLWDNARSEYAMSAVRNCSTLNRLYPAADKRFLRLQVLRGGEPIGWSVLLDTQMQKHRHFGNMRVGAIVDCLANPADALDVIACASAELRQRKVDLIVSNQSHAAWRGALEKCGFLNGPSNFLLAASPKLAASFMPLDDHIHEFHLNRGDCDGPLTLLSGSNHV